MSSRSEARAARREPRWAVLALALAAAGCALIDPLSDVAPDPSGGATSGGAGGGCTVDADCGPNDCRVATCEHGACSITNAPAEKVTLTQIVGDCRENRCDGDGNVVSAVDDGDLPADAGGCTIDSCDHGEPMHVPKAADTPCQGGTCDDAGHCIQCGVPGECPGLDDFCKTRTCIDFTCGFVFEAEGKKLPSTEQVVGDCAQIACDGMGGHETLVDDHDKPKDDLDCTDDVCANGTPSNPLKALGSPCHQDGGALCDEAGVCVECLAGTDCPSGVCSPLRTCVPAHCVNAIQDSGESDTDCGGTECPGCGAGKVCGSPADCLDLVCTALVCQAATCTDAVRNGGESDVDCGGSVCGACVDGKLCNAASDCASRVCKAGHCAAPTCMDGVQNATETDRDCGGGACPGCGAGASCVGNPDCTSTYCNAGACTLLNACDAATAEDHTGQSTLTVSFNGAGIYTPQCFVVSVGTVVTFSGMFDHNPLDGGKVEGGTAFPDPASPFMPETASGSSKSFPLTTPGGYPFYDGQRYASPGRIGAAFVVP